MERTLDLHLAAAEISMLIEALDAYEYWQLGDPLPRNNGEVFIPGDLPPDEDRYWGPEPEVGEVEAEAIEQVRACRELADQLRATVDGMNGFRTNG
jgi:hypothetical protein